MRCLLLILSNGGAMTFDSLTPPQRCFVYYPQFHIDIVGLIEAGILEYIGEDRCNWTRTKTSLAEYFNCIGRIGRIPKGFWDPIESCFMVKHEPLIRGSLTRLLSKQIASNLDSYDFKEIKKVVEKYRKRYSKEKEIVSNFDTALNKINGIIEDFYSQPEWERETIEVVHETYEEISKALRSIRFDNSGGGKKHSKLNDTIPN